MFILYLNRINYRLWIRLEWKEIQIDEEFEHKIHKYSIYSQQFDHNGRKRQKTCFFSKIHVFQLIFFNIMTVTCIMLRQSSLQYKLLNFFIWIKVRDSLKNEITINYSKWLISIKVICFNRVIFACQ